MVPLSVSLPLVAAAAGAAVAAETASAIPAASSAPVYLSFYASSRFVCWVFARALSRCAALERPADTPVRNQALTERR